MSAKTPTVRRRRHRPTEPARLLAELRLRRVASRHGELIVIVRDGDEQDAGDDVERSTALTVRTEIEEPVG